MENLASMIGDLEKARSRAKLREKLEALPPPRGKTPRSHSERFIGYIARPYTHGWAYLFLRPSIRWSGRFKALWDRLS